MRRYSYSTKLENAIYNILGLTDRDCYQRDSNDREVWCGVEVMQSNGEVLEWDEYLFIDIPRIEMRLVVEEETISCDGVLFFGDGTIEFHDADGLYAYNWADFTIESIERMLKALKEIEK